MSWHYPISITHAPSGHPGGIVDRLRLMQESSLTLCPFFEGAFCPLSREATRGEGALRILWRRGLGIRRRCGSRGRTDSKIRRVWFVNGTACRRRSTYTHETRTVLSSSTSLTSSSAFWVTALTFKGLYVGCCPAL